MYSEQNSSQDSFSTKVQSFQFLYDLEFRTLALLLTEEFKIHSADSLLLKNHMAFFKFGIAGYFELLAVKMISVGSQGMNFKE